MFNELTEIILKSAIILAIPLGSLPLILQLERRGAAWIQKRVGPNRVGPYGLFQPLADVFKFLFKEEVMPSHVRPFFYVLAPILGLLVALVPLAGIPICSPFFIGDTKIYPEVFRTDLGIFYVFAAAALGPYGILLAGWASNNKFSMLGALRACAQMVSYELAISTAIVAIFFVYGTNDLHLMVEKQSESLYGFVPAWGVFLQPVGCILFLVGIFAESNRLPFDLAEGESELVAGYHIEYSSMKFAMFFMSEYVHMIVLSILFIMVYFGGYGLLPGMGFVVDSFPFLLHFLQILSLVFKVALMMWLFIWVRWSIPRFRYDQLMNLGWKRLLPLGIANLLATVIFDYIRSLS